jgi:hypothetical protein
VYESSGPWVIDPYAIFVRWCVAQMVPCKGL